MALDARARPVLKNIFSAKTRALVRQTHLSCDEKATYGKHEQTHEGSKLVRSCGIAHLCKAPRIPRMATIARMIGGAGTGKTTALIETMSRAIEAGGLEANEIGFVSFTRAARREAAERAAAQFGVPIDRLELDGWFRTLHSVCHRSLGIGKELLTNDKASREWLRENLQQDIAGLPDGQEAEPFAADGSAEGSNDLSIALGLWSAARARLTPLEPIWELAKGCHDQTPDWGTVRSLIDRYELSKRLDGRCDFTDLLGRFAGYSFGIDGHERVTPQGDVPGLPVWFFDEQQDTSALLDAVCHRLIDNPTVRWVYVVGDPFQAIYGWAGADASLFMAWEVQKERILDQSYRCAPPILEAGERCLLTCSDYFDRHIRPAAHDGTTEAVWWTQSLLDELRPDEPWLVLARTNFQARRIAKALDARGTPWQPTRGLGGWNKPAANEALCALLRLQKGEGKITPDEWRRILDVVPSKVEGTDLLTRGTKARWTNEYKPDGGSLFDWGATQALAELVRSGRWVELVDGAERFVAVAERYGEGIATDPRIKVGTIHSVKGQEADSVLVLTTSSAPVSRSAESEHGADEERRVAYVAATRARKRLIVAKEKNAAYRMELEA